MQTKPGQAPVAPCDYPSQDNPDDKQRNATRMAENAKANEQYQQGTDLSHPVIGIIAVESGAGKVAVSPSSGVPLTGLQASPVIQHIDTALIAYLPNVPRPPFGDFDLFYIHSKMCAHNKIPVTAVQFDIPTGKYLIVPVGPEYKEEGFPFEAARGLGLNNLPCRIIGDCPPHPDGEPGPIPPLASTQPKPEPVPLEPAIFDQERLEPLFAALSEAISSMAKGVVRRVGDAARRVMDHEDLSQEGLLALLAMLRRGTPCLQSGLNVKQYVNRVMTNQAFSAWRKVRREKLWQVSGHAVHETQTSDALEEMKRDAALTAWKCEIQGQIAGTEREAVAVFSGLPMLEAAAAGYWVGGMGYVKAAKTTGLSLHQVRVLTYDLTHRPSRLTELLAALKQNLSGLYRQSPKHAASIYPRTLKRLLEDDRIRP